MMKTNLLTLAALISSYSCIGYHPQTQQEVPKVEAKLKTLEDYVKNTSVVNSAFIINHGEDPIYFLTGENPPEISGKYTLTFQENKIPLTIQRNPDNSITLSDLDENTKNLNAIIRGNDNSFTIYSSWHIKFSGCEIENALIFYGQKENDGNLRTKYLSVPVQVLTPEICSNPVGTTGIACLTKD